MADPTFDLDRYKMKNARALRRAADGADFLHLECARIIGERLAVTNRSFTAPALLFDGPFSQQIEHHIMLEKPPVSAAFARIQKPDGKDEIMNLEPDSHDLIISIFDLHRVNKLPNLLLQVNHALKSDGLFMAILPCEGTLVELRSCLLNAEAETNSGVSSRIDLFPHIRQIGDLVRKIGFKLPVVDLEERTVRYTGFKALIKDLRDNGSGNCNYGEIHPLARKTVQRLEDFYRDTETDSDGKLRATMAMACISGWKEDESQQKPLKPGSASNRLSDFL